MPPKPIFKTDVPFSETKWPEIPAPTQIIILDLLCNLLEPLGHHRQTHIHPSKGKSRSRRRTQKRQHDKPSGSEDGPTPPPPPEIANHVLVGLNSVTRHLSSLAANAAPESMPAAAGGVRQAATHEDGDQEDAMEGVQYSEAHKGRNAQALPPRPLTVVIIPHPMPSSSLPHAHLPTLVHLSARTDAQPTRLVALSTSAESRLASVLHLPRVGAIGIMESAPGANGLVEYVRSQVPPTESRWIEEALKAEWEGVKTQVQPS